MARTGIIHRTMGAGLPPWAAPIVASRQLKGAAQNGVVECDAVTGLPVRIAWSRADGTPAFDQELGFLGVAPGFAVAVADFLAASYDTDNSRFTVRGAVKVMRQGLFAFLGGPSCAGLTPATFTTQHMVDFTDFLRRKECQDDYRNLLYSSAARCLTSLPGFTASIPSNPFPSGKAGPATAIPGNDLMRILSTAAEDVLMHMARFEARRDPDHALWLDPATATRLQLMADIRSRFPKGPIGDGVMRMPSREELEEAAPDLLGRVQAIGFREMQSWWGPCHTNIGSSLVLLEWFFRLNLELARDMRWGEIDTIGEETIVNKAKRRAGGIRQLPGYVNGKEPVNADKLRTFLKDWTADVRAAAPADASRVFLLWRGTPGTPTCHLGSKNAPMRVLKYFEDSYGLPHFTAKMIRPTTIEVVDIASEGSRKLAPAVGRHTPDVRRRNYTTADADRRALLSIGMAMPVRARDMRARYQAFALGRIGGNHVAATPGWNCSNPYYRGFSSAPEGELCDAIGRCAVCRFGRPDLDCVRSYASVLALLEAVRAENVKGREAEWIGVFRPIEMALMNRWIPSFDSAVRATPAAALPHVPTLKGAIRWPTY